MYIVQRGLCAVDGKLYASGTYFGDGCVVDARRDHNACAIALLDAHAIAREDLASLIASGDFGATRYYRAMMRHIKIPSLHNDASLSRGSRRTSHGIALHAARARFRRTLMLVGKAAVAEHVGGGHPRRAPDEVWADALAFLICSLGSKII